MQAYRWPDINVKSMNAMKRGRDKRKPADQRYTMTVAEAATQMPCGTEFFDRKRHQSKATARDQAKVSVRNQGDNHLKRCDTCKERVRDR